jgi:small subunit ribosomal protein S14
MKHLLLRDRSRKKLFKTLETRFLALKFISHNQKINSSLRWEALLLLSKFSKKSRVMLKNRCFLTGRNRGYLRFFNLSRIQTRDLARGGVLPFVNKSSW